MNKKTTRVFLAAILALSVTAAVMTPVMTSVYAAPAPAGTAAPAPDSPTDSQTPAPAPQPSAPEPPKDSNNPHSGHH